MRGTGPVPCRRRADRTLHSPWGAVARMAKLPCNAGLRVGAASALNPLTLSNRRILLKLGCVPMLLDFYTNQDLANIVFMPGKISYNTSPCARSRTGAINLNKEEPLSIYGSWANHWIKVVPDGANLPSPFLNVANKSLSQNQFSLRWNQANISCPKKLSY